MFLEHVAMACKPCNNEKRRDDQTPELTLAKSGWESFLSHDSSRCPQNCKTCAYWTTIWPDSETRRTRLEEAMKRIHGFQQPYAHYIDWSSHARVLIRERVEMLYRDCQKFATEEIEKLTLGTELNFSALVTRVPTI
jgi:hypothetical protein